MEAVRVLLLVGLNLDTSKSLAYVVNLKFEGKSDVSIFDFVSAKTHNRQLL